MKINTFKRLTCVIALSLFSTAAFSQDLEDFLREGYLEDSEKIDPAFCCGKFVQHDVEFPHGLAFRWNKALEKGCILEPTRSAGIIISVPIHQRLNEKTT